MHGCRGRNGLWNAEVTPPSTIKNEVKDYLSYVALNNLLPVRSCLWLEQSTGFKVWLMARDAALHSGEIHMTTYMKQYQNDGILGLLF